MMCMERRKRGIGLMLTLTMLTACATGSPGSSGFCDIYEPVYTSPEDTEETLRQVTRNNAAWLELCDD